MKFFNLITATVLGIIPIIPPTLYSQTSASLTGSLVGQDGDSPGVCDLSLVGTSLTGQSLANGSFSLTGTVSTKRAPEPASPFSVLEGSNLIFNSEKPTGNIRISIADVTGAEEKVLFHSRVFVGKNKIDLLEALSAYKGIRHFLIRVESGGQEEYHRVLWMDGALLPMGKSTGGRENLLLKKSQAADSLAVSCEGFVVKKVEVTSLTQNLGALKIYKPSILFIPVDDLNDWIGVMGGHPQAITPNLDRLAAQGVLFENAHCPGPACQPSRNAIMTGLRPDASGILGNFAEQKLRTLHPNLELLPNWFTDHGYWSAAGGKILHYIADPQSWDYNYPNDNNMWPPYTYPDSRPMSIPYENWMYIEFDWGAFDMTDEEFGSDYLIAKWAASELAKDHDKPFFIASGIYRPHLPWFAPKMYYDMHPLAQVELPPGILVGDEDDLPAGQSLGATNSRYHQHILENDAWQEAVQAYLASTTYADAMVGHILDSLDASEYADNTVVVLWSDHGWQLGEKRHWRKFALWRNITRVPMIWRVPPGMPGMPLGTPAGTRVSEPVNLQDIYNTLTEITGIEDKPGTYGHSLVPLLKDPDATWAHKGSLTFHGEEETYSVSAEEWRYIHYSGGAEELYHIAEDPHEYDNLAEVSAHSEKLQEMRDLGIEMINDEPKTGMKNQN